MHWLDLLVVLVFAALSLAGFLPPLLTRLKRVREAPGSWEVGAVGPRIGQTIAEVLFQTKVIRERFLAGLAHALVFWGFLFFVFVTIDHFCLLLGFSPLGWLGGVGEVFEHIVAFWAVAVSLGILYLSYRRFIERPSALGEHLSVSSGLVAALILILMVTYLLGLYSFDPWTMAWKVNWWVHALAILAFPPLIVRSKHLHLLLGPFAVFLRDPVPGRIAPLNFEAEEFGAEKAAELRKHIALGAFSCVECGRCQDHCPAYATGKKLNPKQIALDVRRALLEGPEKEAVGEFVDPEMLWACTSCAACVYQCPVGVEQLAPIMELRRSQVSEGEFPEPFNNLFKNLERSGNPWSYPRDKAAERMAELEIPGYEEQEVLWWMGCMARYDDNYLPTVKAFNRILKAAGVSYGVLKNEKCTGDAARRAGNEMVFAELAMHNIEQLNGTKAKAIVSTCPHCLKALEEYKQLGENQGLEEGLRPGLELVHATRFVHRLYEQGKLALQGEAASPQVVAHDPCYLSRHESGGDAGDMRFLLDMAATTCREPARSGKRSFCCGAGGAQVFNEEGGDRYVYTERTEELLAKGDGAPIATACPFCRLMLLDGCKDKGIEDSKRVVDVLDLVAARLP